ncbi:MAG: hypothetical protein ACI4R8_02235 [Candidatus Caccovivens sp.]
MKFGKQKQYKKCPRCGNKCLARQEQCEECGLIFSRLEFASNKAAKKKILHFDKDFVIYTNQLPKDVSWWKLVLFTFLFGLMGGHYYYVGKYAKGGLMTAGFVYLVFCAFFSDQIYSFLDAGAYLPIGILGFSWIVSLIYVCCKKFKVPIIVEMPKNQAEYDRADFEKTRNELKNENAKLKEQKSSKQLKNNQNTKNNVKSRNE